MRAPIVMDLRYRGLDFARAILLVLIVPYHSSLIYGVGGKWRLSSVEHSDLFDHFSTFIHSFRSAAFYILAGFFFVLLVEKYGTRKALAQRLLRIGLPLICVGFSLNFLMNALSTDRTFSISTNYFIGGQWLGHLWFIGNLIFYYVVAILFARRFTTEKVRPVPIRVITLIALLVTPLVSVFAATMGSKIYTGQFLFLTFGTIYKYFPYFVLGMFLWSQKETLFQFTKSRGAMVLIAVSVCLHALLYALGPKALGWNNFVIGTYLCGAWLAVSSILFLNSVGDHTSRIIAALTKSGYTIYLIHAPFVVLFYVFIIAKLNLNIFVGFVALCSLVLMVSYVVHFHLLEKYKYLMLLFNGKMGVNRHREVFADSGVSMRDSADHIDQTRGVDRAANPQPSRL